MGGRARLPPHGAGHRRRRRRRRRGADGAARRRRGARAARAARPGALRPVGRRRRRLRPDRRDAAAAGPARTPWAGTWSGCSRWTARSSARCVRCSAGSPACRCRATACCDALGRLHGELAEVRAVLGDPGTSVRLVLTPGGGGGRRGAPHPDLAVAVRLPGGRRRRQPHLPGGDRCRPLARGLGQCAGRRMLAEVDRVVRAAAGAARGVPVRGAGRRRRARCVRRGDVRRPRPGRAADRSAVRWTSSAPATSSCSRWRCRSPTARRWSWSGPATSWCCRVGSSRRVLALPSALRRCTVVGAVLRDGVLRIRFEPDPSLWRGL